MTKYDTDILLATYNGAKYLPDLLSSLDSQTDQSWRLIARDDGSSDDTLALLRAWGRDKGDRFALIEDGRKGLGASGNFNALLEACDADYFLLCDQDDVWLEDKVTHLKAAIRAAEEQSSADTPLIVHTDLIVVDEALNVIAESFWEHQLIRMLPDRDPWKLITLQNTVTGCAMIGNAALLQAALPVPEEAMVHDWWLAQVASLKGRILRQLEPTILYRQHGNNTLGAQHWSAWLALKLAIQAPFSSLDRPREILMETQIQAKAIISQLGDKLCRDQLEFLSTYAQLRHVNFIKRRYFALRNGLWYRGPVRSFVFYAAL